MIYYFFLLSLALVYSLLAIDCLSKDILLDFFKMEMP